MPYIETLDIAEADGDLLATYRALAARPIPSVYRPPHGGAPGIHRAHSLDAGLLAAAFGATSTMYAGDALSWPERELIAASASRVNQCVY